MTGYEGDGTHLDRFQAPGKAEAEQEQAARVVWQRFLQSQQHASLNRRLQRRDRDYTDGYQYEGGTKANIEAQGRPALTVNLIKPTVDLVVGQERTNRLDAVAVPRQSADVDGANAHTQYLKYAMDACDGPMQISDAFYDAVTVGEGWVEVGVRDRHDLRDDLADGLEDEPFIRWENWENVYVDPASRRRDLSDARWLVRAVWMDVDEAEETWEEHRDRFEELLSYPSEMQEGYLADVKADLPDPYGDVTDWDGYGLGTQEYLDIERRQVLVIECQYRAIEPVRHIIHPEFGAIPFDPENQDHVNRLYATADEDLDTLFPLIKRKVIRISHVCGPLLLDDERLKHKHGQFTLTPIYGYQDRQGRHYGIVRNLIDAQDDYNKRRSTALFLLAAVQILFESDAVNSVSRLLQQIADPLGAIEVEPGALKEGKIQVTRFADLASGHLQESQLAAEEIKAMSGVNNELRGLAAPSQSGRAILAQQQQGNMMLASLFDNLRFALKRVAYQMASLTMQYMSKPKQLRLQDAPTGKEWLSLNMPGGVTLAEFKVDWAIEEAQATASVRQANLQLFQDFMTKMPPEIGMALLPDLIEASDIPGKDKIKFTAEEVLRRLGVLPPPGMPPGMPMPPPGMPPGAVPPGAPPPGPMPGPPMPPPASPQAGPPAV